MADFLSCKRSAATANFRGRRRAVIEKIVTSGATMEYVSTNSEELDRPMLLVLFIGHGHPLNAIQRNEFTTALALAR